MEEILCVRLCKGPHGKLSIRATITHFRFGIEPCRPRATAALRVRAPVFETGRMRKTSNAIRVRQNEHG